MSEQNAVSRLRSLLLTAAFIFALLSAIALILTLTPVSVFSRTIIVGVSCFVVLIVYSMVRRRIVLLTVNLQQRISEESARLAQGAQAVEAQRREPQPAAATARDLAECVLQNVPCPVLVADAEGLLVSANPAAQSLLGRDVVQAGESLTDWSSRHSLQYPSGQPVPPGANPLTRAIQENQATERAEFLLSSSQAPLCVELISVPILSHEGNRCVGAVAFLKDVTDLRRSRQQEVIVQARCAILDRIGRQLVLAETIEQVHHSVIESALALLPPETGSARASLYSFEDDVKRLVLLAEAPDRRPRRPRTRQQMQPPSWPFNARSPLLWQLYVSRQPMVSADIAEDERFDAGADSLLLSLTEGVPVRSLLAAPMMMGKEVSGHLMLTSDKADALGDEALRDALTSVAALAATARSRILLDAQTHQQAAEIKALWSVAQAAAACKDVRELAAALASQVLAVLGAESCTLSLWEFTPDGERRLHCLQGGNEDALLPGQTTSVFPAGCAGCDHLTEEASLRGGSVMRSGITNPSFGECRWRAFAGQSGAHSVLASPIRWGGEALGALTFYRSGDAPFTPLQVELMETFAMLIAAAVQNVGSRSRTVV